MNSIGWSIDTSVAAENPSDCVLDWKIPCRALDRHFTCTFTRQRSARRRSTDTDPLLEDSRCRQASVIVVLVVSVAVSASKLAGSNYGMSLDDLRF
jgi:hypothetical protein